MKQQKENVAPVISLLYYSFSRTLSISIPRFPNKSVNEFTSILTIMCGIIAYQFRAIGFFLAAQQTPIVIAINTQIRHFAL